MEWSSSALCSQREMFLPGRTPNKIRVFAPQYKELCTLHSDFFALLLFCVQYLDSSLRAILPDRSWERSSAGWTLEWLQHSGQLLSSQPTAPTLELRHRWVHFAFPRR
uniref:Uncharacterized protein n=1 Tax=Sphaerodactylus townsendi TaxID=933632 RepID=A0ACB8G452_9SAUR